jgi:RNA polymerase sigma-70 factor (ECF subfamily)
MDSYRPIMVSDDCLLSHIDALYRYGMVLSCNAAVASDLVQETYVRALNFRNKLRGDNNIKSWMFTILRNIWLNQPRRERSSPGLTERDCAEMMELAGGLQDDPHQQLMQKVETERVREAIHRLPDDFREVIFLREYEDLSYREIAELVGCPVGTVMSRLARARARLRNLLKDFRIEKGHCGRLDARAGDARLRIRE